MRIVLAIDGSPASTQARDLVASLKWPAGSTITVVAAFAIPATWFAGAELTGGDWLAAAEDAVRSVADDTTTSMASSLQGRGWVIERRVVAGRAANVILEVADEVDADLIVMGSRGHGRIASMLLGSVSAEVAAQSRRSVLVARTGRVSRMLVATDGSECAIAIPGLLGAWGALEGVPAVALGVAPVDSPAYELMVSLYTLGAEPVERQRQELVARFRAQAAAMAASLASIGIQAQAEVRTGDAAREIIEAAKEHAADLVITGSRGLRGLDQLFLGSVARNVLLHAHASVLVVRAGGTPLQR